MIIADSIDLGHRLRLDQGTDKLRGLEHAALQHTKRDEHKQETSIQSAVVVETGRSTAKAEAYAPARSEAMGHESQQKPTANTAPSPLPGTNSTVAVAEDSRIKINTHFKELVAHEAATAARTEAPAESGSVVVGEGASLKMNVHADRVNSGGGTILLDDGASLKMNVHVGQLEGSGGSIIVGQGASLQLNLHADTAVSGGSIVVMDGAKVKSTVQVDVLAASAPTGSIKSTPAAVSAPMAQEGNSSSLDPFVAVQTIQPQAVKQASGRDEKEQLKSDDDEAGQNEDPRWRLYREVLDSMNTKPGLRRALGRAYGKEPSSQHGKPHEKG
jgi:hypothetical protein